MAGKKRQALLSKFFSHQGKEKIDQLQDSVTVSRFFAPKAASLTSSADASLEDKTSQVYLHSSQTRCKAEDGSTQDDIWNTFLPSKRAKDSRAESTPQFNHDPHNPKLEEQLNQSTTCNHENLQGYTISQGTKLTPLEKQFLDIKRKHPNAVLLVEVGYKYQFFGEDAEIASKVLHIFCAEGSNNFKSASIPVHRLFVHVRRLVDAGYKVGVVKQTETAALKKLGANKSKPFTRELSALYTKATLLGEDVEGGNSDFNEAGYLCSINEEVSSNRNSVCIGLVAISCTTGDVVYDRFDDDPSRSQLDTRLSHLNPAEVIVPQALASRTSKLLQTYATEGLRIERLPDHLFDMSLAATIVTDLYSGNDHISASRLNTALNLPPLALSCLAALVQHLKEFKLDRVLKRTSSPRIFSLSGQEMVLNACTLRNLDILREQATGSYQGSLLWLLDHTLTPFGKRHLHQWVTKPLICIEDITQRQKAVDLLATSFHTASEDLCLLLKGLPDLERGLTSINAQRASPRELYLIVSAMAKVLSHFSLLKAHSALQESSLLLKIVKAICNGFESSVRYLEMLNKNAARSNEKIDLFIGCDHLFPSKRLLCEKMASVKEILNEYRTDIARILRLPSFDYVCVNGEEYLIEVPRAKVPIIPSDWTTVSATKQKVRFRTEFICKQMEILAQHAEQLQLDAAKAWENFLESFSTIYDQCRRGVKALATLDCLLSFMHTARLPGYVKPVFLPSSRGLEQEDDTYLDDRLNGTATISSKNSLKKFTPILKILQGQHPTVSAMLDGQFVPNSTIMDGDRVRCMIVTGPNMGGKSSYIKQVALIVIMAQLGCYVPAEAVELTVFNKIFTRMGASDDIQHGRSTFMTELLEASEALRCADNQSLVIMDELGRGTSTHDGVAIAYATLQFLIREIKCLTLFVTHYPNLAEIVAEHPRHVVCTHMSFIEEKVSDEMESRILFLHQLKRGLAKKSYGLNVARLACLPEEVLQCAAQKSLELEKIVRARRKGDQSSVLRFAKALREASEPESTVNLLTAIQHFSTC